MKKPGTGYRKTGITGALCFAFFFLLSFSAHAQRVQNSNDSLLRASQPPLDFTSPSSPSLSGSIAAIVNESVISVNDVKNRLKLALLSAGMADTSDNRTRVMPQVMRGLIEEQLQMQEGKRLDVSVGADEIDRALKSIAVDNKIPGGDMVGFLKAHDIPPSALRNQIKATLTWNKVVMRALRPRIEIGDDEVDAVVQRLRANAGRQEYLVSEIYLAVDKAQDEDQVRSLAENLADQIRSGATFGAVARQFSQDAGAATGGDIGWVQSGQMAPEVDKVLQTMQAPSIAGPIRSASGYHIIGLRDKRTVAGNLKDMTVSLQQAFSPYSATKNREALTADAERMKKDLNGCDGLKDKIAQSFPGWRWQDLGEVKVGDAPAWLASAIGNMDEGHAGEPMAMDKGMLVLFLCHRTMPDGGVDKNAIRNAIGTERLDLLSRRHLRDLRRDSLVDMRLKGVP